MDHFGPFWPEEAHFGPFRSANRTLAIPETYLKIASESKDVFGSDREFHFVRLALSRVPDTKISLARALTPSQRPLRDRLMSRGKNCLPTVSRQFLTRNYPHPNCLIKCPPNCLSPTREGFLSSFKINPAVRVIARQVRDKNCLAAIFAPRHQSVSQGPLGLHSRPSQEWPRQTKPKKGQFMNFSRGHSGTKVQICESCLFS